jgi:hypothetical protein
VNEVRFKENFVSHAHLHISILSNNSAHLLLVMIVAAAADIVVREFDVMITLRVLVQLRPLVLFDIFVGNVFLCG